MCFGNFLTNHHLIWTNDGKLLKVIEMVMKSCRTSEGQRSMNPAMKVSSTCRKRRQEKRRRPRKRRGRKHRKECGRRALVLTRTLNPEVHYGYAPEHLAPKYKKLSLSPNTV